MGTRWIGNTCYERFLGILYGCKSGVAYIEQTFYRAVRTVEKFFKFFKFFLFFFNILKVELNNLQLELNNLKHSTHVLVEVLRRYTLTSCK